MKVWSFMKVIHLISGGDSGGAKTHVLSLLQHLNQTITAQLVCFRDGPFAQEARALGIPTEIMAGNNIFRIRRRLVHYIRQGGFELIHCHGSRANMIGALLRKPKVLILDDSTSAVDTATDAKIRKAFREEIPGTTKIIIAQRVSSVQDADRILVLDNGQINGLGTHEELLKTNAIYQEVYNSQTQGSGDFDKQGGEQ